jgi:uncharacterized protein YPO0396
MAFLGVGVFRCSRISMLNCRANDWKSDFVALVVQEYNRCVLLITPSQHHNILKITTSSALVVQEYNRCVLLITPSQHHNILKITTSSDLVVQGENHCATPITTSQYYSIKKS